MEYIELQPLFDNYHRRIAKIDLSFWLPMLTKTPLAV